MCSHRDLNTLSNKRKRGYRQKFIKFGVNHRSLQWKSARSQETRFLQFCQHLNLNHHSILDVGCGFADIVPLLQKHYVDFSYTGVDFVKEFIDTAKLRYPQFSFFNQDYFQKPLPQKFDFIICSGVLNGNLGDPQTTVKFRHKAIRTMFSHCNYSLAFNMAGADPQPKNFTKSKIFYADLKEVVKFSSTLTSSLTLVSDYLPKDFTLILSHQDYPN